MRIPLLAVLSLTTAALSADTSPDAAALLAQHTHAFAYSAAGLSGPGADFLHTATARSQFVLLGEDHMDHEVPIFAEALFRLLHEAHGFRHLVVEQDPVAIEDALDPVRRGEASRLAEYAGQHVPLYEFDSDEDLTLLAAVGRLVPGPDAIWGVEQATGHTRYLEELIRLAPDATTRAETEALLADAHPADPGPNYTVKWLADLRTPARLAHLADAFHAEPGSRADRLLQGLVKSAEIFGYYTRAEAGEFVGLYNNTVREEVLKANFLRRYHAAAAGGRLPRAMFKFGANHLYHGRNPSSAFPIGNLAHELAIANGGEAYGLYLRPFGAPGYFTYADMPGALRPFLPAVEPTGPVLIDLRALRPYQRLFRLRLADQADAEEFRMLIHGYDALVLLPGSKLATRQLGGRNAPYR